MTRMIVAGSEEFRNYRFLRSQLDAITKRIPDEIEFVSGPGEGADRLGRRYALEHGYSLRVFRPRWNPFRRPGAFRLQKMIDYARQEHALAVFFWAGDGEVYDTISHAGRACIPLKVIRYKRMGVPNT